jgi:hypothetical protein
MTIKKAVPAKRERKVREEASKPTTRTITRSAKTGRLVPKKEAKANPTETVTEKVVVKIDRKKLVIPKTLAGAADALYTTRADRLAAQNQIKPLTEFEKLLREHIIENLPKSQANGISGKVAKAEIVKRDVPQITDEAKFLAYAKKKGNEDLVKIVPNMEAIQARWDNNKVVPGVGTYTIITVSSTKR